jgi:hypothetical protein
VGVPAPSGEGARRGRGRLEIEALYGWFDRRPFDESSREMVWVAAQSRRDEHDAIADL